MSQLLCFVGHVFSQDQIDDLRPAIAKSFEGNDINLWFADDYLSGGHVFDKISGAIDRSFICIFELSDANKPNVFLELGYALGKNKPCFFLLRKGNSMPSDLQGFDRIEYESMKQVTEKLTGFWPQILQRALKQPNVKPIAEIAARPLVIVGELIMAMGLDPVQLVLEAAKQGMSKEEVQETLVFLQKNKVIEPIQDNWEFADGGKAALNNLIKAARRVKHD